VVLSEPEDDLSDRECVVLPLIALGYTNQEIAKQLYLSVRTVEAHRRHILNTLRLETRSDSCGTRSITGSCSSADPARRAGRGVSATGYGVRAEGVGRCLRYLRLVTLRILRLSGASAAAGGAVLTRHAVPL
jgi:DNA-binding CsgD family transcriptional regulator